jgi:hypothetical protein
MFEKQPVLVKLLTCSSPLELDAEFTGEVKSATTVRNFNILNYIELS